MGNLGFMQVLEGFWSKRLYFLRFWKVSDGNLWFHVGFWRFWKPNVVVAKVLKGFWWNSLAYQRFWKVWMSKRTRASKPFNFIIETMLCEAFWSSRPPEHLKHHFSLSNRCPVSHASKQIAFIHTSWIIEIPFADKGIPMISKER